jgi:hypothetical protein
MGGERDGGSAKTEQLRVNEADRRCVKSPELFLVVAPARCSPGRQGGKEGEREWEGRDVHVSVCMYITNFHSVFTIGSSEVDP